MTRICFIGFGEVARAWCKTLPLADEQVTLHAYDIATPTQRRDFEEAAAAVNANLHESAEQAISGSNVVVSAVTASQCVAAAENAANYVGPGQIYLDINSVSPKSKSEAGQRISGAGASFVDMAIMGPVANAGHRTPALVSGKMDAHLDKLLISLNFDSQTVHGGVGAASGIKMIRSLFVKGLEALTVQTLTAAERAGCRDHVLESLTASFPGLGFEQFAAYQFERVAKHGIRRAAEMRESAYTYRELGFPAGYDLAMAIAGLQETVGGQAIDGAETVAEWTRKAIHALESNNG